MNLLNIMLSAENMLQKNMYRIILFFLKFKGKKTNRKHCIGIHTYTVYILKTREITTKSVSLGLGDSTGGWAWDGIYKKMQCYWNIIILNRGDGFMVISFILHNLHIHVLLKVNFSLFLEEYTLFWL